MGAYCPPKSVAVSIASIHHSLSFLPPLHPFPLLPLASFTPSLFCYPLYFLYPFSLLYYSLNFLYLSLPPLLLFASLTAPLPSFYYSLPSFLLPFAFFPWYVLLSSTLCPLFCCSLPCLSTISLPLNHHLLPFYCPSSPLSSFILWLSFTSFIAPFPLSCHLYYISFGLFSTLHFLLPPSTRYPLVLFLLILPSAFPYSDPHPLVFPHRPKHLPIYTMRFQAFTRICM